VQRVLIRILPEAIRDHAANIQHGFKQGKSCLANLFVSCDEMTSFMAKGRGSGMVYLDLASSLLQSAVVCLQPDW